MEYSVIGKRIPKVDALAKATGEAKFATDFYHPNMLWAKVLRSPLPHAQFLPLWRVCQLSLCSNESGWNGDRKHRRHGYVTRAAAITPEKICELSIGSPSVTVGNCAGSVLSEPLNGGSPEGEPGLQSCRGPLFTEGLLELDQTLLKK
jgi:hypothetical protein